MERTEPAAQPGNQTFRGLINRIKPYARFARFVLLRLLTLLFAVTVSVYLTILISTKGTPIESEFPESKTQFTGWLSGIKEPRLKRFFDSGPIVPEFILNLQFLYSGLTLNLGHTSQIIINFGEVQSDTVRGVILDTLPRTLLLFGTANILIFFSSIFVALFLSRKYGGPVDRTISVLTPLFSPPAWFFGLILIVFNAKVLHIYTGGFLDFWPAKFDLAFLPVLAKYMLPPILALFLSKFFFSVYTWRSFFLVYSTEDYIELAHAKGLPNKDIERRYILRPALPSFLTSFAMLMITIWQEAIILELFFSVAGIGQTFYAALKYNDKALIVGLTVTFAYLLALSVFILDILYALVDPRIRVGQQSQGGSLVIEKKRKQRSLFTRRKEPHFEEHGWGNRLDLGMPVTEKKRLPLAKRLEATWYSLRTQFEPMHEIRRYPSAIMGITIVVILCGLSIYTLAKVPYEAATSLWNSDQDNWVRNPKLAPPAWINLFNGNSLPRNLEMDSSKGAGKKTTKNSSGTMSEITISFPFNYPYKVFPQNILLFPTAKFQEKPPLIDIYLITPDGREIKIGSEIVNRPLHLFFANDNQLKHKLNTDHPIVALLSAPGGTSRNAQPQQGNYELRIVGTFFEKSVDLNADFLMLGQSYGAAGTDNRGRDLSIALLWGMPVALAFGFIGAFCTSFLTMLIAAFGAWFGGWVDGIIQRITEINMIIPAFPVLLIVYMYYSKSFFAILGAAILLNIFGSSIKTYRSAFIQVKELPYIEAARSYGSGNLRMIFRYMLPRIAPILIPQLVILIPAYVYLETTMAYLNMSDPLLPTWGKLIKDAVSNGALDGAYYWLLEPVGILILTSFAFLMLGFALEKILNPRLRDT
jgi:peptide/nickel transport system permease protein